MSLKRLSEESVQPKTKRAKIDSSNSAAGTIQQICLENFMCHSRLALVPNPNVNFITGVNGAGKSSILQAIGLGLGADSKHTKRYTKMADFIKRGTTKAVIEVTLNNQGEDAFKPEVYGESLVFERTIRDNGQCPLVLKDVNGNVKVTKGAREESRRALDSFKIQVDNPVIILQQEEAKQFLKVESPDKLYEFFVKSTMLKQIIDEYKAGFGEIDVIEINVKSLENGLKESVKTLVKKKETINRAKYKDEEWDKLTGDYAWADVKDCGEMLVMIQKTVHEKQTNLKNPNEKLQLLRKEEDMLKDMLTEEEIKIDEERIVYCELDGEITVLNQQISGIKQAEKATIEELKKCDEATSEIKIEITTLEEHLQTILGHSAMDKEQLETEKKRQISALDWEINETGKEIERKSARRLDLNSEEEKLNLNAKTLDEQKTDLHLAINSISQEIREMELLGNRNLAVYGQKYAMVEAEIQNNLNQFDKKPFGPVGRYIHLKSPAEPNSNLAKLVESILSWSLKSYLCHSDRDRRFLGKIFDKVFGEGFKPKLFVSRFLPSRHQVKRANVCVTLMDLLEIQEVAVFNFLVDHVFIESVAVCTNQNDAKKMTTYRNLVPENLKYAVTTDFYKFLPPSSSSSYMTYCLEQRAQGLLSGSSSEKLKQKRSLWSNYVAKLRENDQETSRIKKSRLEIEIQKNFVIGKIQDLHKNISVAKTTLKDLKFKPENYTSESLVKKRALKNKEKMEKKRVAILEQRSAIESELKSVKDIRDRKTTEMSPLKEKWSRVNSKFSQSNAIYVNKCKEIANQEKAVKRLNDELQTLVRKREDAMRKHIKARALAVKMTGEERLKMPNESKEQLNAKIALLKKKKKNGSEDESNLEKIKEDYCKLKEEVKCRNSKLKCQKVYLKEVKEMNEGRREMLLMIRKRIVNMVTRKFNHITRDMAKDIGCNIFLQIDIKKKELGFKFASEDGTLIRTNVSSLSGGEKSFAQMGLICSLWEYMRQVLFRTSLAFITNNPGVRNRWLSLWEHMQPPFRCLDEWDVFLDQVNRNKIQTKLLKLGLTQNDKQFIFLSPQGAIDSKDVSREDRNKMAIIEIKKN